jgi:hypothetical protein
MELEIEISKLNLETSKIGRLTQAEIGKIFDLTKLNVYNGEKIDLTGHVKELFRTRRFDDALYLVDIATILVDGAEAKALTKIVGMNVAEHASLFVPAMHEKYLAYRAYVYGTIAGSVPVKSQ